MAILQLWCVWEPGTSPPETAEPSQWVSESGGLQGGGGPEHWHLTWFQVLLLLTLVAPTPTAAPRDKSSRDGAEAAAAPDLRSKMSHILENVAMAPKALLDLIQASCKAWKSQKLQDISGDGGILMSCPRTQTLPQRTRHWKAFSLRNPLTWKCNFTFLKTCFVLSQPPANYVQLMVSFCPIKSAGKATIHSFTDQRLNRQSLCLPPLFGKRKT